MKNTSQIKKWTRYARINQTTLLHLILKIIKSVLSIEKREQ